MEVKLHISKDATPPGCISTRKLDVYKGLSGICFKIKQCRRFIVFEKDPSTMGISLMHSTKLAPFFIEITDC